jgi:hypothetical protein
MVVKVHSDELEALSNKYGWSYSGDMMIDSWLPFDKNNP